MYRFAVVAAAMFGLTVSVSPIFFNTLPVMLKAIAADTGWSRTAITTGLSLATLSVAVTAPFLGRLVDRFGPRRVIALATIPFGASLVAMRWLDSSYATFLFMAVLAGCFGNGGNTFVYLSFMPRWFSERLGLSLGITSMGIGLGQTVNPLIASHLVTLYGWRFTFLCLGVASTVVTLVCVMVLRDGPSGRGAAMEHAEEEDTVGPSPFRSPTFWRLLISVLLATTAITGCTLTLVPLLTDLGLTLEAAARGAATIGLAVIVGRFAAGLLLDVIGGPIVARITFLLVSCAILLLATGHSATTFLVAAAGLGLGLGSEGDVLAYTVRSAFGIKAYGRVYGYLFGAFNIGVIAGPVLMNLSFDRLGAYEPMLVTAAILAAAAALVFPSIGRAEARLSADHAKASVSSHGAARVVAMQSHQIKSSEAN